MTNAIPFTSAVALVAILSLTPQAAAEGPCEHTASSVRRACGFEAQDDFWISRGICQNVSDSRARRECQAEAQSALREARHDCAQQEDAREDLCDALGQARYDPVIDPSDFLSPDATAASPNPYLPLIPGRTWVYRKPGETITVKVTSDTKVVQGVTTMIVTDIVFSDEGELIEDTVDYVAQHIDGSVWYFGELVKNFENGELANLDGSFTAGVDGAKAGIIMKAIPRVGETYRQEFALNNAEDAAKVLSITASASVPGGSCSGTCLVTEDVTPLSPEHVENKYYAPGIGFLLEIDTSTGERLELQSVTDH